MASMRQGKAVPGHSFYYKVWVVESFLEAANILYYQLQGQANQRMLCVMLVFTM